jgi:uncharacterized protein YqiB (DUF1249 family)
MVPSVPATMMASSACWTRAEPKSGRLGPRSLRPVYHDADAAHDLSIAVAERLHASFEYAALDLALEDGRVAAERTPVCHTNGMA